MSNTVFVYELGTTEEISERWGFLEANVTWRSSAFEGASILLYREEYESADEAQKSGGIYEICCTSGSDLVSSLEAVKCTSLALGHYLCVALKTKEPVSFVEEADEFVSQQMPSSAEGGWA